MGSKFFIYYDNDGNITSVTNEKKAEGAYLETDESEITDFLNGSKDFTKFKISSLSSGTKQIKLSTEPTNLVYKDFFIVDKSNGKEQITITHNLKTNSWNLVVNSEELFNFTFYICKNDNLNFLVRKIDIPAKKVFTVPFIDSLEYKVNEILVLANISYKSYGLIYV